MASGDTASAMENSEQLPLQKIRQDWYQTDTHVIITILAKAAKNVKVVNAENTLSVSALLPSGSDYSMELDLAHPVVPEQCLYKVIPSKIEIKLKKRDGGRWHVLEGNPVQNTVQPIPQEILNAGNRPPKYPTSCKNTRDWDKVVKEIEKQEEEEKPKGDAAVNALLTNIYCNGTDDVRRAMNKSYQESGGTVLSTNWNEVCKKKVEIKPPGGMEWKSWNS